MFLNIGIWILDRAILHHITIDYFTKNSYSVNKQINNLK